VHIVEILSLRSFKFCGKWKAGGGRKALGRESGAEEDGLKGRIKIRKNPGVSTSGFFVS
jgi:hypothetical protein